MSRPKKRKGGRYTPPKSLASPSLSEADEEQQFWAVMRRQDQSLRDRCAALLPSEPPTNTEWQDADLQSMGGEEASDELLIAYWRVHRAAVELDMMELPDLGQVEEFLASGLDPAEALRRWHAELMDEDT